MPTGYEIEKKFSRLGYKARVTNARQLVASNLEQELNEIYNVSLATWNVTVDDALIIPQEEWDDDEDGELSYGTSFLSNYSSEMRNIYQYYNNSREMEDNKYYLFLTDFPIKGNIDAYMT